MVHNLYTYSSAKSSDGRGDKVMNKNLENENHTRSKEEGEIHRMVVEK